MTVPWLGPVRLAIVIAALVTLAGCSDGEATRATVSASGEVPTSPVAGWDLVAIGDSNVAGWGIRPEEPYSPDLAFPGVYARLLGAEQGVTVTRRSYFPSQEGNEVRTVADWNDTLATDEALQNDLSRANVVIVLVGYHNVVPALIFGECGSQWGPLKKCLQAATKTMPSDYDKLFATIQEVVPEGTTVLAGDYGIPTPLYDQWSGKPFWPEMKKAMYEGWRDALEVAAKANGATVVHTYAALNGPKGNKPLADDLTTDGWHFSEKGHERLARIYMAEDGLSAE